MKNNNNPLVSIIIVNYNGKHTPQNSSILITNPSITISGWILDNDKKPIDNAFLLLDDVAFLRIDSEFFRKSDFVNRQDVADSLGLNKALAGWKLSFITSHIDIGYHNISIGFLKNDSFFRLDYPVQICIER